MLVGIRLQPGYYVGNGVGKWPSVGKANPKHEENQHGKADS